MQVASHGQNVELPDTQWVLCDDGLIRKPKEFLPRLDEKNTNIVHMGLIGLSEKTISVDLEVVDGLVASTKMLQEDEIEDLEHEGVNEDDAEDAGLQESDEDFDPCGTVLSNSKVGEFSVINFDL